MRRTLAIVSVLIGTAVAANLPATVSIATYAGFVGLRTCAGSCIYNFNFLQSEGLDRAIGCPYPIYNTCYCNSNIVASATSYLSSCVSSACGETADVPNALSAYGGYCSSAGFPLNVVAQTTLVQGGVSSPSQPTTGPTAAAPTAAMTAALTASPTIAATLVSGSSQTPSISGSSGSTSIPTAGSVDSSNSSNLGPIIGGAVGGALILGIAAVVITVLVLRHRRQMRAQQLTTLPIASTGAAFPPQPPTTEKIPKTPATVHAMRVDGVVGTPHEVESREHGVNSELQGRPWRPGAEMDAVASFPTGSQPFELKG